MNKKAFTLIELLVVVLIIGILAAAALPQYQKAVMKSRYATIKNLTRSLANAQEIYYLANGHYENDISVLDIQFAGCDPSQSYWCQTSTTSFDIYTGSGFCSWDVASIVLDKEGNSVNSYGICLDHSNKPNVAYCGAATTNTTANQVCKSFGGTLAMTGECITAPPDTPCNLYTLP